MIRPHLFLLFFVALIGGVPVCAAEPIVTTDLLRIRSVAMIDVARDGTRAVFAVRSIATIPPDDPAKPDAEPAYRNQSHLFVLELSEAGGSPRQITFGDRNDHSPKISPDGKRIAFVRSGTGGAAARAAGRDTEASSQAWIMRIDGGEPQQLTSFKHGAARPQWSPDGRRLLIVSSIPFDELDGVPAWASERPRRQWGDAAVSPTTQPRPDGSRAEIRAWLERNSTQQNPAVINRLDYQDEQQLRGQMKFDHLYLVDPDSRAAPMTYQFAKRVTNGFYDHTDPAFLPDGQGIMYAAKKPSDQHPDRVLTMGLWRVNENGSNDQQLLAMDGWALTSPKPSRDGSVVAFIGKRIDEPAYRQRQIGLLSLRPDQAPPNASAMAPAWLTDEDSYQGSVESIEWLGAQPALIFTSAMRGSFPLMTISPGLLQPATLIGEHEGVPAGVRAFGAGGGAIVYALTTPANPCVLRVRDGFGERLAFDLNEWVKDKELSMPVEGWITRPDGTRIQYWIMEPTNRELGPPVKKYPLAVAMHGGPAGMWGPGEFTMWHEFQLLCSWGYGVVYCNPRGSGGYGYAFQRANFQDWGDGPAGDVLGVVDQAILKDWVDRDKLVIAGGSYAGYLTVWIIAHDHRFKAAVAQRGVYDFATFFGEGNAWRLVQWSMGGNPYDARFKQIIERNSPMTYVSRIRTPLLIKHGSSDLRTGVSQSEMLYRALKELNRPVEYVRYPGAGHDMSRTGEPLQRMDRLNRMIEFFERFIENPRPAPVASGN